MSAQIFVQWPGRGPQSYARALLLEARRSDLQSSGVVMFSTL